MLGLQARVSFLVLSALAAACALGGGAPAAEGPAFAVTALEVSGPAEIAVGQQVTIVAVVENTGGQAGAYRAELMVDGAMYGVQTVMLAAGETSLVRFVVRPESPGLHTLRLAGETVTFEVSGQPDFSVTELWIDTATTDILPTDPVAVLASIQNEGTGAGTYRAELTLDGQPHSSQDVELGVGEETTIEFFLEAGQPGDYELGVGEAMSLLTVVQPTPAEFVVTDLSVSPAEADPGADVVVSVTVTNGGHLNGSHTVALAVDGTTHRTAEVTLDGGASTTVYFTFPAGAAGRHAISVEGLTTDLRVVAIERPANGTIVLTGLRGGMGRLTIENGNDRDALVVLSKASEPSRPMLAIYLRAGAERTIRRIKDGTYSFFYTLGERWDSGAKAFTSEVTYKSFDGSLQFRTTRVGGGYRYTIWTVTLHTVPGGGTPVSDIGEDEFPSIP